MIDLKARGIMYHLKRPLFTASQLFAAKHIVLYSYFVNDLLEDGCIVSVDRSKPYYIFWIVGTNESIDRSRCNNYIWRKLQKLADQVEADDLENRTKSLIHKQLTAIRGKNETT